MNTPATAEEMECIEALLMLQISPKSKNDKSGPSEPKRAKLENVSSDVGGKKAKARKQRQKNKAARRILHSDAENVPLNTSTTTSKKPLVGIKHDKIKSDGSKNVLQKSNANNVNLNKLEIDGNNQKEFSSLQE